VEINIGKKVISAEIKALDLLKKSISKDFSNAIDVLYKTKGKIIISGLGKSGHIAAKISSTFSSIGSSSVFLHPTEANHGDLGMIKKGDSTILISNSGETSELTNIILHCKKSKIPIISITSEKHSSLAKNANIVLVTPRNVEACPLELAPTSSTTCALVLGDALAITLLTKRGFTKSDFHALHPGGKLGQTLLSVREIMKTNKSLPVIKVGDIVGNAILEMSSKGFGCVGIISTDNKKLFGIITDGDLRRHMTKGLLEKKVEQIMTVNPLTLKQKNKPVGIIHIHEILRLKST